MNGSRLLPNGKNSVSLLARKLFGSREHREFEQMEKEKEERIPLLVVSSVDKYFIEDLIESWHIVTFLENGRLVLIIHNPKGLSGALYGAHIAVRPQQDVLYGGLPLIDLLQLLLFSMGESFWRAMCIFGLMPLCLKRSHAVVDEPPAFHLIN